MNQQIDHSFAQTNFHSNEFREEKKNILIIINLLAGEFLLGLCDTGIRPLLYPCGYASGDGRALAAAFAGSLAVSGARRVASGAQSDVVG